MPLCCNVPESSPVLGCELSLASGGNFGLSSHADMMGRTGCYSPAGTALAGRNHTQRGGGATASARRRLRRHRRHWPRSRRSRRSRRRNSRRSRCSRRSSRRLSGDGGDIDGTGCAFAISVGSTATSRRVGASCAAGGRCDAGRQQRRSQRPSSRAPIAAADRRSQRPSSQRRSPHRSQRPSSLAPQNIGERGLQWNSCMCV